MKVLIHRSSSGTVYSKKSYTGKWPRPLAGLDNKKTINPFVSRVHDKLRCRRLKSFYLCAGVAGGRAQRSDQLEDRGLGRTDQVAHSHTVPQDAERSEERVN